MYIHVISRRQHVHAPDNSTSAQSRRWRGEVLLRALGCCIGGVHLHQQAREARRLKVLKGVRAHVELIVRLRQRVFERFHPAFHEARPGCLDPLARGGADVQTVHKLRARMLLLDVLDVLDKRRHQLWVSQFYFVPLELELGPDLHKVRDALLLHHVRARLKREDLVCAGSTVVRGQRRTFLIETRNECALLLLLLGFWRRRGTALLGLLIGFWHSLSSLGSLGTALRWSQIHCLTFLVIILLVHLGKRGARRRWDQILLCAFRCCLTGVHLHHQAGEARRLEVLKRICRSHLEVLLCQRVDKRLDTAFHESRPRGLDVFASRGADMHAEREFCVRVLVLLVVDVSHKGWYHLWVPQAHLVANKPELGSDLNEGLNLRLRILCVCVIHRAGTRFHSEDVCNLSLLHCNLIPFFHGDHCDLLLLGLLLPGHPGRPEHQG